jgi:hypothetical protein
MSNPESLDDLKRLYAAAPADEPPAALDAAIRARARREMGSPMRAAGFGRRAWRPSLAMAAVLVLTVSVVMVMEREKPEVAGDVAGDVTNVAGIAPPARDLALAPAAKPKADEGAATAAPRAASRESPAQDRKPGMEQPEQGASKPESLLQAPSVATAPAAPDTAAVARSSARQAAGAGAMDALSETTPGRGVALRASPAAESPEAWLRRLAELKQQGKLREFEESLAEFRKRHPEYPVPETLAPAK